MDTTTSHLRLCLPRLLMKDGMHPVRLHLAARLTSRTRKRTHNETLQIKIIGLIALLAVVGVVCGTLVWRQSRPAPAEPTEQVSITGYLGGEKIGLFDDAKFKALAAKQGIAIDYRKAGSPAMMDTDRKGMGYLFPSSRAPSNTAMRKASRPPKATSSSTHRLCYTRTRPWRTARERRTCDQGRFWRVPHGYGQSRGRDGRQHNLGRRRIHGRLRAVPHRLDRSGEVELRQRIRGASCHGAQRRAAGHGRFGGARRQDHRSIFAKSGWMETSSEDSFNQFLTLGVGSKPMMVGYESQLLDLAVNQPDAFKQIKDDVVIVYPTRPCGAPTR